MSDPYIAGLLQHEMSRFGITEARLRRFCWRTHRIPRARVEQVIHRGEPGYLKAWTPIGIADWLEMVRSAWLCQ